MEGRKVGWTDRPYLIGPFQLSSGVQKPKFNHNHFNFCLMKAKWKKDKFNHNHFNSYRVKAKLYPTKLMVESFQCNKPWCSVCVNVTEKNTFNCTVTGKTYKTNHKFDCLKISLVYLLYTPSLVVFSMLDKLLLNFVTGGIIIRMTVGTTEIMTVCKNISMITMCLVIKIF